ncbi:hypothetical protein D3C77_453070 [compost metagenome]
MNSTPQAPEPSEENTMKLIFKMSALVTVAVLSATAFAANKTENPSGFEIYNYSSQLLLAEGGSDRLIDYHLQNALVRNSDSQSSGERYVQMIKEQPTASGGSSMKESLPQIDKSEPRLTSPIIRDREEHRSTH